MQIKLIPHPSGDVTDTVWDEVTVSRPGGKRGVIIIAGCGVMTSAPKTASMATSCHVLDTCSWIIYSFTDVAEPTDISYSFHEGRRAPRVFPRTCVSFFNRIITHAEICINADSDSWRSAGSTGLKTSMKSKVEERKSIAQASQPMCRSEKLANNNFTRVVC